MAYREKMSWLTLTTMVVAYGVYFGIVGPAIGFGRERLFDIIIGFGAVTAVHGLVVIVVSLALWLMAGRAERQRPDERDRAIIRHAASIGYWFLLIGLIWVGVVMPFHAPAWIIINTALGFIVLAELVKDGFILISYRRGWHG